MTDYQVAATPRASEAGSRPRPPSHAALRRRLRRALSGRSVPTGARVGGPQRAAPRFSRGFPARSFPSVPSAPTGLRPEGAGTRRGARVGAAPQGRASLGSAPLVAVLGGFPSRQCSPRAGSSLPSALPVGGGFRAASLRVGGPLAAAPFGSPLPARQRSASYLVPTPPNRTKKLILLRWRGVCASHCRSANSTK